MLQLDRSGSNYDRQMDRVCFVLVRQREVRFAQGAEDLGRLRERRIDSGLLEHNLPDAV